MGCCLDNVRLQKYFFGIIEHFFGKIVLLSAELSDILVFSKAHSQG
jgi:hypothetical protein